MGNWETAPVSGYPFQSICSLPTTQAFLQKLVRNLFAEGNDLFREKDFKLSLVQYVEGLNVADYAASDEVTIPKELLCKLHVNRAACYFAMVSAFTGHPQEPGWTSGVLWVPCDWKRCQEGIQPQHWRRWWHVENFDTSSLYTARPEEGCEGEGACFCWSGLRYWESSSGLCWWGVLEFFTVWRSDCKEPVPSHTESSSVVLEVCLLKSMRRQWERRLWVMAELSVHIKKMILKYSGSKRLCSSIFLRNATAFLYGTTPKQVHPVHNEIFSWDSKLAGSQVIKDCQM